MISALANARQWLPSICQRSGSRGVPGEAMVTKVDRAVLAVAQPERRVEDHRQPMEARDVVRGADMQELVEAQRETYV